MVIGDRFAWGHLPKTGGEATRSMFQLFPDLVRFSDPRGSVEQHATFRDREAQVRGKSLALNIRRLPAWIVSREQHKARWGLFPDYVPTPMDSAEQMAESTFPDYRLSTFLEGAAGRFEIDHWLRMESLSGDFLSFISGFTDVPEDASERIEELGMINANAYDHDLGHWFTKEQVTRLYERNPLWASVEQEVYGELLVGAGR
jgi:hypothetical protein